MNRYRFIEAEVRHEALCNRVGCKMPTSGLSQQAGEAGGSLSVEAHARVGAAPTTTGRAGTARRLGPGKRDGKVQEHEPVVEPPQAMNQLQSGGYGLGSSACLTAAGDSDAGLRNGKEATRKACGVLVARLQGNSWVTAPVNRSTVNMGTVHESPFPPASQVGDGQVRRRLMTHGRSGGPVVVRGRESRSHGEGVQRVGSAVAGMPGGHR